MVKVINAGELNKRVTIQKQTKTRDSFGAEIISWIDENTVWAKFLSANKRSEINMMNQNYFEATAKICIRFCTGINKTMRLKYGNRYFEIIEIQNVEEKNVELLLLCKELL